MGLPIFAQQMIIKHNKERFTFVLNLTFVSTENICNHHHSSQKFIISKVFVMRGPEIWLAITKVCYTQGSLYRGFVIQRELTYNLLARIQGTGLLVLNRGKFS